MRGSTAKRINTTMKNVEATNTTETAAVAETGPARRAGEARLEEGRQPEEERAQGQQGREESRQASQGRAEEAAQGEEHQQERRQSEGGQGAPRVLEKEHRPGPLAPPQGRDDGRDRQGHRL